MQPSGNEQEIRRVLELLRDGKITPDQAAMLLEALDGAGAQPAARGARLRTLHIAVTDTRTGRQKVNVSIPLGLVEVASRLGLTLGVRHAPELADVNFEDIMAAVNSGAQGQILDIDDDDERQHVVVKLE